MATAATPAPPVAPDLSNRAGQNLAPALWSAVRPRQWVKNGLVFAAPAAAGTLFDHSTIVACGVAFLAMCAAASSTYLMNDLSDRVRDREHPTKCRRAIASGELPVGWAVASALALVGVALALVTAIDSAVLLVVAGYLALTTSYSRWLKHVPYLELAVLALGFVLRMLIGAIASTTALSAPFLVVVMTGSLLLATGKRLAEILQLGAAAVVHRPVLAHYRIGVLDGMAGLCAAALLSAYARWALAVRPSGEAMPWLVLSIIPLAVAVGYVTRAVLRGGLGDPTDLIIHDRLLRWAGLAAAVSVFVALYAS